MDLSFILFIALVAIGGILILSRLFSRDNILVEYARGLFPVILIVFILRSFIVEPFRIPSGSMLPTLHIGDFILVNKYTFGIRLPVVNKKVFSIGSPKRGDVMVFRSPENPELKFIKRVVGVPGDELSYKNRVLIINGEPVKHDQDGKYLYRQARLKGRSADQLIETIGDERHRILIDSTHHSRHFDGVTVPPGHYFVMGDNRDHSNDSRYWGFVPESHVVGKAFFIWFSWKSVSGGGVEWSRIGSTID